MVSSAANAFDDINFGVNNHIHDLDMHPSADIVAAALVDGSIQLPIIELSPPYMHHVCSYANASQANVLCSRHHTDAARAVTFSSCGSVVYCGSKDHSISCIDVHTQHLVSHTHNAHQAPINVVHVYDQHLIASGDENGKFSVWDTRDIRRPSLLYTKHENSDFITDMCAVPHQNAMLITSADATLSVWDIRKNGSLIAMSDDVEDEILSVVVLKNEKKVICGTQSGVLMLFSWDNFGDMNDRFIGHPESIDSMVYIDADTLCSASSDGLIRIVQIHPNRLLGVIGDHDELPVEKISLAHDKKCIASSSHDGSIKFWDTSFLFTDDDIEHQCDVDIDSDDGDDNVRMNQSPTRTQTGFFDAL